jgi:hypothetical protein
MLLSPLVKRGWPTVRLVEASPTRSEDSHRKMKSTGRQLFEK